MEIFVQPEIALMFASVFTPLVLDVFNEFFRVTNARVQQITLVCFSVIVAIIFVAITNEEPLELVKDLEAILVSATIVYTTAETVYRQLYKKLTGLRKSVAPIITYTKQGGGK